MRRITLLITMLAITVAGVLAVSFGSSTASAADDPEAALQTFIDAVNAADSDAMAASFAEDGYLLDIDGGGFGVFGMAALQFGFSESEGTEGTHITITNSQVSGDTVSGTVEVVDPGSAAAGVDRYVQTFVAEISGDRIASLVTHYDKHDAQIVQFLEYSLSQEEDGGEDEPDPDSIQLAMGGNQSGEAGVNEFAPGVTGLFVGITEGPDGIEQPSAIRSGTCADLGGVVQGLAPVVGGGAGSIISMSLDDILGSPHALTVSDSADNAGVIVSCANIERSAAGGPTLPSTGSGGSTGMGLSWLMAALALVGVAFAGAGTLAAQRR